MNNMNRAFGIINFAGNHIKVDGLQDFRPVGAFSFLGRYRIIDFPISNMSVEKFAVISFVNHITRSYDNVFMRHLLEALYVFHISGNVGTVNVADLTVFCIHDIQTAAF